MPSTDLPWTVFGRKIKPFALAVSLAVSLAVLGRGNDAGTVLDGLTPAALTVGMAASAAACLLWVGWWWRSRTSLEVGLLMTAGVFADRCFLSWLETGFDSNTTLLSGCWVIAATGAYVLERRGDD